MLSVLGFLTSLGIQTLLMLRGPGLGVRYMAPHKTEQHIEDNDASSFAQRASFFAPACVVLAIFRLV